MFNIGCLFVVSFYFDFHFIVFDFKGGHGYISDLFFYEYSINKTQYFYKQVSLPKKKWFKEF